MHLTQTMLRETQSRPKADLMAPLLWLGLALLLLLAAAPVFAAEVFVVDAKGVDLAPGQKLDGAKPITLEIGQRLTLVTADGRTLKLKGPFQAAPAPELEAAAGDVVDSLKGLIKVREADTTSAGIIRKGTTAVSQPTPWLVEVLHSGDRCLLSGAKTVLWRDSAAATRSDLEIAPADHSWSATAAWPAGSDRLSLPDSMTLHDGQAYQVSVDAAPVNVTVHVIPQSVKSDAAKAAWMIEVGCEAQAKALVEAMR